jgi:hypothetical protein
MCSQGRSWADEGTAGRVTSEWHQGQVEPVWGLAGVIWRAMQAVQVGFGEMAPPKHGQNRSICKGGLQVTLPTDWEGFVSPASQRFTKNVLIHFLGNAVTGGPGDTGVDSGADDIRYGTGTHQQGMPCEVQQ